MQTLNTSFDQQARSLRGLLAKGPTLAVIGSTSFWHHESSDTCAAIGRQLAEIEDLVLITGGVSGVGERVGRSWFNERERLSLPAEIFHVLPVGYQAWDYGVTLFAGSDLGERREILARLARLYLVVEGGPGTVHEGEVALTHGSLLVPVGRSGGYAGKVYPAIERPSFAPSESWHRLGLPTSTPDQIGAAVRDIVRSVIRSEAGTKPES